MPKLALALACVATLCASPAVAQVPAIPLAGVGFGVDTSAADVGDIVRLVRAYLAGPASAGDSAARAAGLWMNAGEPGRRGDDLTRGFAYQGFPATVLQVSSAVTGDSVYLVRLLYGRGDTTGVVRPIALQRLYAVRTPGAPYGWKLSSALPRVTAAWQQLSVGPLAFLYAPGLHPDTARARRSAEYVGWLAQNLDLRAPQRIEYVVAHAADEYFRAIGLDFFVWASGRGQAIGGNGFDRVVLAGDSMAGEGYVHELTHAVLQAGACCANGVAQEGLATYLGGSRRRDRDEMYRVLADYQRAHADATLKAVLDGSAPGTPAETSDASYATDALIVDAFHRKAGWAGVRALARLPRGTEELLAELRRVLPQADLDAWWRQSAVSYPAAARRLIR